MRKLLFATGLFITFTSAALIAQTARLAANIPFDFQMGKKLMPAGKYNFNVDSKVLTIRSGDGHHAMFVLTSPASRRVATTTSVVQFERYGDAYYLSGLWTANSNDGIKVPESTSLKELARRVQNPETTTIALTKE